MKLLLITLVLTSNVNASETKIVTIDQSRYAYQVMQPTVEIKTPITDCILKHELDGMKGEEAAKLCFKGVREL